MTEDQPKRLIFQSSEDFADFQARILKFLGSFSQVQFGIDSMIGMHLRRIMPMLGAELDKQFLGRVRDEQRVPLLKAFANDCSYEGDLTNFTRIYSRAKHVRDFVGHSPGEIAGPVYRTDGPPVIGISRKGNLHKEVPSEIFPSTFDRLTADCLWLHAHALSIAFRANPGGFVYVDGTQVKSMEIPPALPIGGEPLPTG